MGHEIFENLAKARELAEQIKSTIADVRNTVEDSYRLIDRSHEVLNRANKIIYSTVDSSTSHFSKGQR